MFLKQYHAGLEEVIHIVLAPYSAMTWGHDLRHIRPLNHLISSKYVFLSEKRK